MAARQAVPSSWNSPIELPSSRRKTKGIRTPVFGSAVDDIGQLTLERQHLPFLFLEFSARSRIPPFLMSRHSRERISPTRQPER